MPPSSEWQFKLWPLRVSIAVRSLEPDEAFEEPRPGPHEVPGARAVLHPARGSASRVGAAEPSILDREAEGGSLG